MLAEAATTEIARKQDARGFSENKTAARKGGRIFGNARERLKAETGDKVVSSENYLIEPERKKRFKEELHGFQWKRTIVAKNCNSSNSVSSFARWRGKPK